MAHPFKNAAIVSALVLAFIMLQGCSGGGGGGGSGAQPYVNTLNIEVLSRKVTWLTPPRGKGETEVVVQFIVRTLSGEPVALDEVDVTLLVDDKPIDPESVLSQNATPLTSNIRYGLVLDASPSMVTPERTPFEKLKSGAAASVQELQAIWSGNAGTVDWNFTWFSDVISMPFGNDLKSSHILQIPEPRPGEFTKLHAAVHHMALLMKDEYDGKVSAFGKRDHHVMLVFTDGRDNWSMTDNTYLSPTMGVLGGGVFYQTFGYQPITLNDARDAINAHPRLKVHVIGVGNDIHEKDLKVLSGENDKIRIAAGRVGQFMRGDTADIPALFKDITKEFTSIQTHGAKMPLQGKNYEFKVIVALKEHPGQRGEFQFKFRTGDPEYGVTPRAPEILSTPVETSIVGVRYDYQIEVDASPEAQVKVTLPAQNGWLNYNPSTRTLWGIPGPEHVGRSWEIEVEASNGESPNAVQKFSIDVHLDWIPGASGTTNTLNAVWGMTPQDILTVGDGATILRNDASGWKPMTIHATTRNLKGIHGSSLQNVYSTGEGDILRLAGTSWHKVLTGYAMDFNDVWTSYSGDALIVGEGGTILKYNGSYWEFMNSGTQSPLNRIWGPTNNSVFVVGSGGVILHWDGLSWTRMISGTLNDLHDVWGSMEDERTVVAVGAKGTILRFEDNRWKRMQSGVTQDLRGVWGTSGKDIFAVGSWGTILHYDGISWKEMASGTLNNLLDVWGFNARQVLAVGSGGLILEYTVR